MSLQPLYDVKARLEQTAIAGVGLLGEDFRLRRAAESFKPLAAASPVFGRIDAGLDKLLSAPPGEQTGLLLDLLALVDAVAYTQAKTGGTGELFPLTGGPGQYQELSYSRLHPLLTALTGTGGGRMNQLKDTWENHPKFFSDYRVLSALIAGLGDSYSDLAELNEFILKEQGAWIVPFLKEGFDPSGKKEMARRVEVVSALEGAAATPWLREVLPLAKKDVRAAVLAALGEDPENVPLLLDLSKTERGANREAVLRALTKQDGEEVRAFWTAELTKTEASVAFLQAAQTDWAAALVAQGLRNRLENFILRGEQVSTGERGELGNWLASMGGKAGPSSAAFWRWADEHAADIAGLKNNIGRPLGFEENLSNILLYSLCTAGPGPLCELCRELWGNHRDRTHYFPHALLSALITCPAAEVYQEFSPYVERSSGVRKAQALKDTFKYVFWNQKEGCYQISHNYFHVLAHVSTRATSLAAPLDRRWFDLLLKIPDMGDILRRLVPPEDTELCEKLVAYQYRNMLNGSFIQEDVAYLREHGWTDWRGFLDKKVRKDGSLTTYAVVRLLNETSLTGPEKAEELRSLYKIVQEQHIAHKRPTWPEQRVQEQIAAWEAE